MKNIIFIILGIIAVALIGLAVWQLMWMSDVVDNYDATRSIKGPEREVYIKEDRFQDKGANAVITDQPAEEEAGTVVGSPGIQIESEVEKKGKEEQATVVPDRPLKLESKEVKSIPAKEPQAVINKRDSKKRDAIRKKIAPSGNDKLVIKEEDGTVSIELKSDKPLPRRRKGITRTPIPARKPLNIPKRSVRPHATSTSPY